MKQTWQIATVHTKYMWRVDKAFYTTAYICKALGTIQIVQKGGRGGAKKCGI